jgi:hypothetical protein
VSLVLLVLLVLLVQLVLLLVLLYRAVALRSMVQVVIAARAPESAPHQPSPAAPVAAAPTLAQERLLLLLCWGAASAAGFGRSCRFACRLYVDGRHFDRLR